MRGAGERLGARTLYFLSVSQKRTSSFVPVSPSERVRRRAIWAGAVREQRPHYARLRVMTLKESLLTPRLAVFTLGGDTPLTSYGANCVVFSGYHFNYEEADLKGLPAALDALRSIQAERFVPGHGPSGGAELAQEQARYHRTVAQLIRDASSPTEARVAIRARFPAYRLEVAIESALNLFWPSESQP